MTDSRANNFETMDQVPYFYIAFDSLEVREYCNNVKISIFLKYQKKSKFQKKTIDRYLVLEDQLRNECVPYHETKTEIPEFEFMG